MQLETWGIIAAVIIGFLSLAKLFEFLVQREKRMLEASRKKRRELESSMAHVARQTESLARDREAVRQLADQKAVGFPWLATAYADYFELGDLELASVLDQKKHPAPRAAEAIRTVAAKRKLAEREARIHKYLVTYYEDLFPWLADFRSEEIDDLLITIPETSANSSPEDDPVRHWLTEEEYQKLGSVEKSQLALDRYWKRRKNRWEIGRDFERFIGYTLEQRGYSVYYQGIIQGFEDLGRDLVATNGEQTRIVQCKYWSQEKLIHEKHVFQLFGTAVEYYLKQSAVPGFHQVDLFPELLKKGQVVAELVTSTKLSDCAKSFANVLGIEFRECVPLEPYPMIKCNVSRRTGERIYHLPMDQQYDKTIVEEERNECYASTVVEAENLGFRRSFKWRGNGPGELDT